MNTMTVSVDVF